MPNNYYNGITAYTTKLSSGDYLSLNKIIPTIKAHFVPASHEDDVAHRSEVTIPDIYAYSRNASHILEPQEQQFPKHMPSDYLAPFIQKVEIKSVNLYKIHIPVIASSEQEVHVAAAAVYDLLEDIFGENVLHIKTGSVTPDNYDVDYGKMEIIKSIKKDPQPTV